jgi:hypothetical protein
MKAINTYLLFLAILLACGTTKSPYAIYKDKNELIVIDKEADPDLKKLRELKSNEIDRTELVPKNEFSSRVFGPQADNGVLFIYTIHYDRKRTADLKTTLDQIVEDYETSKESYLFILDGFIWKDIEQIKNIRLEELSAVTKLPFTTAKSIYGERAKENTVLVTTKRAK